MMTYKAAVAFLFDLLPMYQRSGASAYKDNLDNTLKLDRHFGHPHQQFKTIHVAGTNGKGSVSHLLASVLQEAGYKTGLYTSPHLRDFRERIKINGEMISESQVVRFVEDNKSIIEKLQPSFFELTVAMAFDYFAEQDVDFAIVEVGMGGRLDSTNIITPEVSVITNIGMDHTAFLGNKLTDIAFEKGGIIKHGIPLVVGREQDEVLPVFEKLSIEREAPMVLARKMYNLEVIGADEKFQYIRITKDEAVCFKALRLPLLGHYQLENLTTVFSVFDILRQKADFLCSNEQFEAGISNVVRNTGLQGRWQVLGRNPLVVCDAGHNEDGIRVALGQIQKAKYSKLHIVIGMVNDKDIKGILKLFPANATYYFTRAAIPRSLPPSDLQKEGHAAGLHGQCYNDVAEAVCAAKKNASGNDLIFIGGSSFVVAEVV